MMKSVCVLAHKPGSSREEFHAYYEANHAPLGARHFPFRRYVRNHLIDHADIGFDTISEFWAEDLGALTGLMSGPVGDIMREDERKFMDQSRIAPGGADEHVLSPGGPTGPDGQRCAVLLDWDAAGERQDELLVWARTVADQSPGVSIDFVRSWSEVAFPAQAVLWVPDAAIVTEPPAGVRARTLRVRRAETPASALMA